MRAGSRRRAGPERLYRLCCAESWTSPATRIADGGKAAAVRLGSPLCDSDRRCATRTAAMPELGSESAGRARLRRQGCFPKQGRIAELAAQQGGEERGARGRVSLMSRSMDGPPR